MYPIFFHRRRSSTAASLLFLLLVCAFCAGQDLPTAKPESVGLSSEGTDDRHLHGATESHRRPDSRLRSERPGVSGHQRLIAQHVGTAALGCPAERSSTGERIQATDISSPVIQSRHLFQSGGNLRARGPRLHSPLPIAAGFAGKIHARLSAQAENILHLCDRRVRD